MAEGLSVDITLDDSSVVSIGGKRTGASVDGVHLMCPPRISRDGLRI